MKIIKNYTWKHKMMVYFKVGDVLLTELQIKFILFNLILISYILLS